jgi:hypothetical protein
MRDKIAANFKRVPQFALMGSKLFATFLNAGLPAPEMIVAGRRCYFA